MEDTKSVAVLQTFLTKHPSVYFVRLHWVDFSGVLRTRIVTTTRALQLAQGDGHYTLAQNCMIIPISTAPECFPEGPQVWQLHPDWTSIRLCGFAPKHCSIMCSVSRDGVTAPFARCPRSLLVDVIGCFEQQHATKLLVGFEIEFVLLDESLSIPKSLDRIAGYSMTAGLRGRTLTAMEEITEVLERCGIGVYHFHTEIADQLEIALAPMTALQAIDALMYAQETIRAVCIGHEVKASMTPRPVLDGPQNGCHMHLSMSPSFATDSFLAGILGRMKALCAFGMPNFDSYVRVTDDAAGIWIGWGTENRDLPVRRITENHWEFRFADATANFYLFLAVVLKAGSDGMVEKQSLSWRDCPVFLEKLDDVQLGEYGIVERMPSSFQVALIAAKSDDSIRQWIGNEMVEQYIGVKEKEIQTFSRMSDEARRKKYLNFF